MARMGKVRVLVVDDDKQRVEVFQRCLGADFDVVEARPGVSAAKLLESEDFDLLVSDKRGSLTGNASRLDFVGSCPSTRRLIETIERVTREDGDVLVLGEVGSGKARVARAIHQNRGQAAGAFLCIRLAELDAEQMEAAVFDNAVTQLHSGGTLFIDGIENMPVDAQVRLVRERDTLWPGWRMILATQSRNDIASPALREHVSPREIEIRPLRERGEDIPELAVHFVAKICEQLGRQGVSLSREAMAELCAYDWPGNVSELRDVIEQAVARSEDNSQIGSGLLSEGQNAIVGQVVEDIIGGSRGLDAAMAELEAAVIREALQQQHGNRSAAARQLKLPRQTLQDRMKKHGLWQS